MARPKKNNADYFSHDNSMRNDDKIKAVRRKFWLEWYAIWCMLLEKLTESDNFEIILDGISYELISWDFEIPSDLLKNIVDYLILLKLLVKENNIIYSNWLKERLQSVIDKRNRNRDNISDRKRDDSGKFVTETDRNSTTPGISVTETPQSKVKESKIKYIKEYEDFILANKNITSIILKVFFALWYKPNESLEEFRKWVQERIINTHNINSLDNFEFIMNNFYDYWKEQSINKRVNKIWKTTLTNSFHLKDIRK